MKILLINSNPVVSRLTALSARKESVALDEIKDISELKNGDYHIVFVDAESFTKEISNFLKNSNITKRVCFYTQDDKNRDNIFNFEILKPFLPSEVSAILRDTKIEMEQEENLDIDIDNSKQKEEYLNLSELISTKKDDLEPINLIEKSVIEDTDEKETEEKLLHELSIAKEQIDEIKKENLDLELETESPIERKEEPKLEEKIELNKEIEKPIIKEEKITDNELFELDNSDTIEDNDNELFTKKIDKTEDELLNFDLESKNEIDFDTNTKILDKDEISNIKNLLNNETSDDLSFDDMIITTTTTPVTSTEPTIETKKKKKKKEKKIKETQREEGKVAVDVITDTIKAMPVEELRALLRGTKINITIEFPNDI
jgi:hypothetical protein